MTRTKLKFNDDMRQHVPPEQLWNEFHGDLEFDYEHEVYWPNLLEICQKKHDERYEKWVKAGKHFGESEIYLRGGDAQSVGEAKVEEPVAVEKATEVSEASEESTAGAPQEKIGAEAPAPVPATVS